MKENKKHKKLKIIVVVLIVCVMLELIYGKDYSKIDSIDMGCFGMRFVSGCFILIELFILIEKLLNSKESFSEIYIKYISNILIVYFILVIGVGIGLRYMEEKEALEYHNKNGSVITATKNDTRYFYINNNRYKYYGNDNNEYEKQKRLISIYEEITKESNQYYRYFLVFTTGLNLIGMEKVFYLIYSILALITSLQFMYYKIYFTNLEKTELL